MTKYKGVKAPAVSRLNPVIHEQGRLGIMSALAARPAQTFNELKSLLGMTDGNLAAHLRLLEKAKYVGITKKFVGRKPQTTIRISRKGEIAFAHYVSVLGEIVNRK